MVHDGFRDGRHVCGETRRRRSIRRIYAHLLHATHRNQRLGCPPSTSFRRPSARSPSRSHPSQADNLAKSQYEMILMTTCAEHSDNVPVSVRTWRRCFLGCPMVFGSMVEVIALCHVVDVDRRRGWKARVGRDEMEYEPLYAAFVPPEPVGTFPGPLPPTALLRILGIDTSFCKPEKIRKKTLHACSRRPFIWGRHFCRVMSFEFSNSRSSDRYASRRRVTESKSSRQVCGNSGHDIST